MLVFDVNETLLDVSAMRPAVAAALGDADLVPVWFGHLLRNSMVAALTGVFRPFDALGVAALVSVAAARGVALEDSEAQAVVRGMRTLPPHPDAAPALGRLRDAGFRCAALSNSSADMLADQLGNAGLAPLFEAVMSVEAVGTYKPAPAVYRHAAESLGIPIGRMRMVAAHDWDVTGAIRAGARGAFVARPGMSLSSVGEVPDIVGADLQEVADLVVGAPSGGR